MESMPPDRIFQMLKLFAMGATGLECDREEVRSFLDKKVRDRELAFSGGQYRLPPK
jgi:hypothetical protein